MNAGRPTIDERSLVSARLLVDLVTNTLDPGYAAAAARDDPSRGRKPVEQVALALGCLVVGFLLVVAYVHTNRGAPQAAKVHDRLVTRVHNAQHDADALSTELSGIERRLAALRARSLPQSGALARQLQRAELAAGQTAVSGPGLTVTLREPPAATPSAVAGRGGTTPIEATNILTDRDVRSVVNELWSDGAEAIAVNGVRLTPLSAIRFAGQAVLVDFEAITSPYRIDAIGNADDLSVAFAQSRVASRYQTLAGVDHIGFSFKDSKRLHLPASAPVAPRYAVAEPTASRTGRP